MSIINCKLGKLEYLQAQNFSAAHCFTTRFGGVSSGCCESMNIGTHRGDAWENVLENYRILGQAIGFDPEKLVLTHQTHTDIVKVADRSFMGAGLYGPELSDCDGLITNTPGVGLVVFSADCTPILLEDPVTGAVGAVHAGWRGTAAGIVAKAAEKMVDFFGCRPENIRAAIGPNIGQCCFETDGDVPEAILKALGDEAQAYIRQNGSKYHLDLKAINALWLEWIGVRSIEISTECTACRPDRFWSHRRVGGNRGSQGAIIICKEETP